MIKVLALLIMASVPLFFAGAKPDTAPGIKKKPLEITNVLVVRAGTGATISWETNSRAEGAVALEDYYIPAETVATRHSITIPSVNEGVAFRIFSFSAVYGAAIPYDSIFTF